MAWVVGVCGRNDMPNEQMGSYIPAESTYEVHRHRHVLHHLGHRFLPSDGDNGATVGRPIST